MTTTHPIKSGIRGISWNRQHGKWHVRIKVDGKYGSFGLYDDLDEAAEIAAQARAGLIEPSSVARRRRAHEPPRPVTRPGTPPPDLTAVSTQHLIYELHRRKAI